MATAEQPDVMMPDLDGPTTFRRLQADARTRDIPVILLAAKAQPADHRSFEELGVTGVLNKQIDLRLIDLAARLIDA